MSYTGYTMSKTASQGSHKTKPKISIIVPTYNSSENIDKFLEALTKSTYKDFEVVINDDIRTDDSTRQVIDIYSKILTIVYLKKNKMMAQARKLGAKHARGEILIHLDSDMRVSPGLLEECIDKITNQNYDALIIPEESVGIGFWAKCKWIEKKMYEGVSEIESLRVIKKSIYDYLDGHDEAMVFSEDKDFDIRVKQAGYHVGRTKHNLLHDEGHLRLFVTLRKKLYYSNTANVFAIKHPDHFKWQANPFHRYGIYLKNSKYLFMHPLLYIGAWFVKTAEYLFSLSGYILKTFR